MIPERLASFPSSAAHGSALAARTDAAIPNTANAQSLNVVPIPVDTNGANPYVVGLTTLWWVPLDHTRSLTPLSSGVTAQWAL